MIQNEFYNKANEYALGRPTYPEEIIQKLKELGIGEHSVVADVGAGTGLLTRLLTKLGCTIYAVEPNEDMLHACKQYCEDYSDIEFIPAPAENTQIQAHHLDAIFVAQAFHWFDKARAKVEFQKILKEDGYVIYLWNDMQLEGAFEKAYIQLLNQYQVKTTAAIAKFDPDQDKRIFLGQPFEKLNYTNQQVLNVEELIANATSLSYTPTKLSDNYHEFVQQITNLFNVHQEEGQVILHYQTEMCIGQFLK
jgi:ubiquinone/menaquinone biosynthesis C-methylase UbiE